MTDKIHVQLGAREGGKSFWQNITLEKLLDAGKTVYIADKHGMTKKKRKGRLTVIERLKYDRTETSR